MKKTNFDSFLEEQLKDPTFAERFESAGEAWGVALQLAALREKSGLTQKELAEKLHTSQQQISRLESPSYEGHSLSMLRRFAHALDAEVKVSIEPAPRPAMVAESRAKYGRATDDLGSEKRRMKLIRNSTAEFLIFTGQAGEQSIEARYEDETVWLSQKLMAALFEVSVPTINEHLKKIFETGELELDSVIRNFRITAADGKNYSTKHYNLDAIISVGYRVNSVRATQFRQWATQVLREFAIKGYVLDRKRMENGAFLGEDYFERLLEEIREIRLSERRFYQKITDLYTTSVDYNRDAPTTKIFFAKVQNKLHFAVHGHTAAELISERADSTQEHMGLTTWEKAPDGKVLKTDVSIGKNYLSKDELQSLGRIVNVYLDLAEERARRRIPMTMEDWAKRLDAFLEFDEREILQDAGTVSAEIARTHAESEFEKYRIVQDRLFESDFDRDVQRLLREREGKNE